jgi:hypothetical protein
MSKFVTYILIAKSSIFVCVARESKNVDTTDCRPSSMGELKCIHAHDAKSSNTCELIEDDNRSMFYNWGQDCRSFARGKALIFYDESHFGHAGSIKKCFQHIGYDVKLLDIYKMKKTISKETFDSLDFCMAS